VDRPLGRGRRLAFHEERTWGPASDCFCRLLRVEWFAVPKGATVSVDNTDQITMLDARMIAVCLGVGIAAFALIGPLAGRRNA